MEVTGKEDRNVLWGERYFFDRICSDLSADCGGLIFLAVTSVGQRVVTLFNGMGNSFPK